MHRFLDDLGREWSVVITGHGAKRVHRHVGFRLTFATCPQILLWIGDLMRDPDQLRAVLVALADRQTIPCGASVEDLTSAMNDSSLQRAVPSLLRAIADSTSSLKTQAGLRSLATKFESQAVPVPSL